MQHPALFARRQLIPLRHGIRRAQGRHDIIIDSHQIRVRRAQAHFDHLANANNDANPELMDSHLSPTGGRAIPVVILLDADFVERGWWGSRPRALQAWVNSEGAALSKEDRYLEARRWYVADRGESTATEIAQLIADAAVRVPAAGAV